MADIFLSLNQFSRSKKILLIILFIAAVIALFKIGFPRREENSKNRKFVEENVSGGPQVNIGESFEFKAIDANRKEIPVAYTVVSAERKQAIKVKNEERTPVSGRDYLLIRIEIQNTQPQRVAIATADRIRLEGENGKLFAPDYHNGNVVVDPISTKKDLVAFAVNADQKSFSFQIGELTGEKQKIEVNF